ncbi:M6 family metalloprotease domain-containing protein, partial [Enterococcus sp. LJL128]
MKKRKRFFSCLGGLLLASSLMIGTEAQAVSVANERQTIEQPNGSRFEVTIRGDEFNSYYLTDDGAIVKRGSDNYWYYETTDSYNKGASSLFKYGIDNRPMNALTEAEIVESSVQSQDFLSDTTSKLRSQMKWSKDQNLLVILVEFDDVSLSTTEAEWENKIFSESGKSMRTYYQEQTEGQIDIKPAIDSYGANDGIVKVKLNRKHPNTGINISATLSREIMKEALEKADEYVDFAQYDTRNREKPNYLEQDELHVMTIYAGYEASKQTNMTIPGVRGHKYQFYYLPKLDGKEIKYYTTFGEKMDFGGSNNNKIASIGVIAHEFGHDLGLPDLYNTTGSGKGLGATSLMAGGSWNAERGEVSGTTPAGLDAYSKEQLGMPVQVVDLDENPEGIYELRTLLNKVDNPNILRVNTENSWEYFLIENRQFEGFDKGYQSMFFHSGGIAVYRVDKRYGQNVSVGEQLVTLLEAEQNITGASKMDANNPWYGDPFYYIGTGIHKKTQANSVTKTTNPSTKLSNGNYGEFSIEVLDAPATSMKVKISKHRPVESVSFDFSEKTIEAGESFEANPSIIPENASNKNLKWESADETIAVVDKEGKVTGVKAGQTTITVKSEDGGKEASFILTVTRIPVVLEDIIVNENVLFVDVNETKQAPITLQPENAYLDELVWTIQDQKLAKVDRNGKITGLEKGKTTLKITSKDKKIVKEITLLIGDDHGNTTDTATKINLNETIKARIDYTFDDDVFEISEAEKLNAVIIESPTGTPWSVLPTVNGVQTSDWFKHFQYEGKYYSVISKINNNRYIPMDKVRFVMDYNVLKRQ